MDARVHMVSSSTSSGPVCMSSNGERRPFIDEAYMVKTPVFIAESGVFRNDIYSQNSLVQQTNHVDGFAEPQIRPGESESCETREQ